MSNIDDELRQAIAEGDDQTDREAVSSAADAGTASTVDDSDDEDSNGKRNLGLVLGLLAIGGGILSLVLGSSSDGLQHDTSVDKVLAAGSDAEDRLLNVEGTLVHGTLMKREEPCEYRFKLRPTDANQEGQLAVRFPSCIVPDNFRDVAGMDVTVSARGRLNDGVLTADHISTKCPTKYEMQQRQKLGEQAPHAEGKQIITFDEG